MGSIIDPYRDQVVAACIKNATDAEIHRILKLAGCGVGRERVRSWLIDETKAGRIPPRTFHVRRGRRPMKEPKQGSPSSKVKRSLDLLEHIDKQDFPARDAALLILTPYSSKPPNSQQARLVLGTYGMDIPEGGDEEPDFAAYAQQIGSRRIQTFGDMDYYLLARWTKDLRQEIPSTREEAEQLNINVLKRAREIRQTMLNAARGTRKP